MAEFADVRSDRIVNRIIWDGLTPFEANGQLIQSGDLPEGWDIGWRLVESVWGPPADPEEAGE